MSNLVYLSFKYTLFTVNDVYEINHISLFAVIYQNISRKPKRKVSVGCE